ncbi:MAG: NAD(P)H-hydrate dehydratase, partial [Anaerolineae bacterium]|nr:NAD(P)H-hydrate dehydratase [Anaerolineae bacterium]
MKVVTAAQMQSLEAAAAAAGQGYEEMMTCAGQAVAQAIMDLGLPEGARILVLIGPGNNGGDGLVAARLLHGKGARVTGYVWKRVTDEDPNYRLAVDLGVEIVRLSEDADLSRFRALLAESEVVIDALLGTGAKGALRGDLARLLGALREGMALMGPAEPALIRPGWPVARLRRRPLVVAVDLPSGMNADTGEVDALTPRADMTVTFGLPKLGLFRFPGAGLVGDLVVADIGIPASLTADIDLELADQAMVAPLLPERPPDANKGTFGRVLVVAGSTNYTGAPYLAALGASRVGAGLVTLALPQPVYPIVAARAVEPTYLLLPSDMGALTPLALDVLGPVLEGYKALLLGPGLGREQPTVDFVRQLVGLKPAGGRVRLGFVGRETVQEARSYQLPVTVVDADALNALAEAPEWWRETSARLVLTPHPGELARLLDTTVEAIQADRLAAAREAAARWSQTVVLKGAYTVVAAPEGRATLLPFANPALASAGTGDVLAGAIAGFLAQGLAPESAAVVGAYVHGVAGELARQA